MELELEKVRKTGIEEYQLKIVGNMTMDIREETTEYGKQFFASIKTEQEGVKRQVMTFSQEIDGSVIMSIVKESGLTDEQLRDIFAKSAELIIEMNK